MKSDRWRKVEDIYHAASDTPAAERRLFLVEACAGDDDLQREVEDLLRQGEASGNILDRPVRQLLDQPELEAGQVLGPYRILGLIGSGGMGRVYKAFDTRLGRVVAIKMSRAGFTGRFRREARAVAALNHPHICTLYDLGPNYLVMEYVEGTPIQGPLPLPQALKVAIAICDSLDAAHTRGIVHRDLKPANILLTESGPKLLDFGLAKVEPAPGCVPDSMTWASTVQTTIAGTIQYMSPEQLQGRGADSRSDIFSFGTVLFEMLTGHPAFAADNSASLIAAILTAQPQVRQYLPSLPVALERVLERALAKEPEQRWQSARDLKAALEWVAAPAPAPVPAPTATRRNWAAWALAALFCFSTAVLAWARWGPVLRVKPVAALSKTTASRAPQLMVFDRSGRSFGTLGPSADYSNLAISPDGRRLAVSIRDATNKRDIWIFDLLKGDQTRLTNNPADETNPVWSPDGSEILYCSDRQGRRDLYARSSAERPERLVLASELDKNPLDWARDGSAIYYNNGRPDGGHEVWMLPLKGKDRVPRMYLSSPETRDWIALSPDTRWVLYRAGRLQTSRLVFRPLLSQAEDWTVGDAGVIEGHWLGDGRQFCYIDGENMMAQDLTVSGSRARLGTPKRLFRVPRPNTFGRNAFAVTPDGKRFVIRTGE